MSEQKTTMPSSTGALNETSYEDEEEMTVTLELEDGSVTCAVIVILTLDAQDYIVLLPLDDNGENEDGNVWIYRYSEDENDVEAEPVLGYIDNDEEYERICTVYEEYLAESEHDEILSE
ncbi:MAG: DUF1292 domain-containing protein [Lachnospiraceae bacterium]